MTVFGDLLRNHRLRAALTQEELAQRAGLSVRALGKLESGVTVRPRPVTVRLLAGALGLRGPAHTLFTTAAFGICTLDNDNEAPGGLLAAGVPAADARRREATA